MGFFYLGHSKRRVGEVFGEMVGTRMLYEGLALWRVILEGCGMEAGRKPGCGGRIRDVPHQVMRRGGDRRAP